MVITYNRDGVTISRRSPDQPSCHKLWKHNRTVVSPKASLLSFLLSMHIVLLNGFFLSNLGPSGPTIYGQLINFLSFCILFFLYSFIEAIFSPTLRSSLLDVFTCYRRRRAYHVVNVQNKINCAMQTLRKCIFRRLYTGVAVKSSQM